MYAYIYMYIYIRNRVVWKYRAPQLPAPRCAYIYMYIYICLYIYEIASFESTELRSYLPPGAPRTSLLQKALPLNAPALERRNLYIYMYIHVYIYLIYICSSLLQKALPLYAPSLGRPNLYIYVYISCIYMQLAGSTRLCLCTRLP